MATVKRLPLIAFNAVIISNLDVSVSVCEIYSHAYGLHETVMFSPKSLGCHFVFMFRVGFWKSFAVLQYCEYWHFIGNYSSKKNH